MWLQILITLFSCSYITAQSTYTVETHCNCENNETWCIFSTPNSNSPIESTCQNRCPQSEHSQRRLKLNQQYSCSITDEDISCCCRMPSPKYSKKKFGNCTIRNLKSQLADQIYKLSEGEFLHKKYNKINPSAEAIPGVIRSPAVIILVLAPLFILLLYARRKCSSRNRATARPAENTIRKEDFDLSRTNKKNH